MEGRAAAPLQAFCSDSEINTAAVLTRSGPPPQEPRLSLFGPLAFGSSGFPYRKLPRFEDGPCRIVRERWRAVSDGKASAGSSFRRRGKARRTSQPFDPLQAAVVSSDWCAIGRKDSEPLARRCIQLLDLSRNDLFVALGAGAPLCLLSVLELVPLDFQLIVVDPSDERLLPLKGIPTLRTVQMDPLSFAMFPLQVEKILVDEDVALSDGGHKVLDRLFHRLPRGGRLLVLKRSSVGSDSERSASPIAASNLEIDECLRKLGFEVQHDALTSARGRFDFILATKSRTS